MTGWLGLATVTSETPKAHHAEGLATDRKSCTMLEVARLAHLSFRHRFMMLVLVASHVGIWGCTAWPPGNPRPGPGAGAQLEGFRAVRCGESQTKIG